MLVAFLLFCSSLSSQNSCTVFTVDQYTDVSILPSIQYAPDLLDFSGNNFVPTARLIKASNNSCPSSPLLILIHGGGFTSGNSLLMDSLAFKFAKLGYVCASINYRLGWEGAVCPTDSSQAVRAWYRAVQDINTAIHFFKSNYNTYQIDTNSIFLTGWSAGGYAAIGAAYTDLPDEIPTSCADLGPISLAANSLNQLPSIKAVATFSASFLFPQHIANGQKPAIILFNNAADAYQIPLQCGKWWNYGNCGNSFPQACGISSVLPILESNNISTNHIIYNYITNNDFNSHWLHNPAYFPYWEEETDSMAVFFQQFISTESPVILNQIISENTVNILIPANTEYLIPDKLNAKLFSLNGSYIMNVVEGKLNPLQPGIYFLQSPKINIKIIVN